MWLAVILFYAVVSDKVEIYIQNNSHANANTVVRIYYINHADCHITRQVSPLYTHQGAVQLYYVTSRDLVS